MTDSQRERGWSRRGFMGGVVGAAALAAVGCRPRDPLRDTEVPHWDAEVDVLVAGSGAAGTSAAIEAAHAGAETLVLESLAKLGGSSGMSGGVIYLGGGTPIQRACGFEDSPEAMYDYIVSASGLHADRARIQLYCERSLEMFDWLVEHGVPYKEEFTDALKEVPMSDASLYYSGSELAWPYRDLARPAPRGHVPSEPGMTGGRRLMQALLPAARQLGVNFQTESTGRRLIQASDGRVVGMELEQGGEVRRIRARRGVVLACGGFIHNRDMVRLHAPELYECSVPWGNMGDLGEGILMGLGAGGVGLRMNQGFAVLPLYDPAHVLHGIVVNRAGQRFMPEEGYHGFLGDQLAFHQQGKGWLITDADSQYGYDDYRVVEAARAPTLVDLERSLELPVDSLVRTVDYYNYHAAQGSDPQFHKHPNYLRPLRKPPFVAYDLSTEHAFIAAHTFGGLHTSLHSEVLDAHGEAIPGLYAAGRTSASMPVAPYIASGISVGDCVFFGRQAGRHAARQGG